MVDLSGGSIGPIEHGISNIVFVIPGSVVLGLSVMDLLYGFEAVSGANNEDPIIMDPIPDASEFPIPTDAELLAMLDQLTDLSHEDREMLREDLTKKIAAQSAFGGFPIDASYTYQTIMLFVLVALVALVVVFFGYKLYKSLVERERKREEKQKNKQLKKKK